MASLIKCPNCGIYNEKVDYCISCGTLLSFEKRRELEIAEEKKERQERERIYKEESSASFDTYTNHKYFIVRAFAKVSRTLWLAFIGFGIVLAWIIAAIAA